MLVVEAVAKRWHFNDPHVKIIIFISAILLLSILFSATQATYLKEHMTRGMSVFVALSNILLFSYLNAKMGVLKLANLTKILALATTVTSLVTLIQATTGSLRFLSANYYIVNTDPRDVGLTEHPIEAGAMGSYGVVLCLVIIILARKRLTLRLLGLGGLALNMAAVIAASSLTAFFALLASLVALLAVNKSYKLMAALVLASFVILPYVVVLLQGSLIFTKIEDLLYAGESFTTVVTRTDQIAQTINSFTLSNVLTGQGYSELELPTGIEIHNTPLAAVFHYGILGLFAQLLIIGFVIRTIVTAQSKSMRALLFALLLIFLGNYLTGPAISRRSVWVPLLTLSMAVAIRAPQAVAKRRQPAIRSRSGPISIV